LHFEAEYYFKDDYIFVLTTFFVFRREMTYCLLVSISKNVDKVKHIFSYSYNRYISGTNIYIYIKFKYFTNFDLFVLINSFLNLFEFLIFKFLFKGVDSILYLVIFIYCAVSIYKTIKILTNIIGFYRAFYF